MKNRLFSLFMMPSAFLFLSLGNSATVVGDWEGELQAGGQSILLVIHIERTDTGYKAAFDSPSQGAFGIAFDAVRHHH